MNETTAKELGIQPIVANQAEYAGGLVVETKFGVIDSLRLNDVTVDSVPVHMANMDHFLPLYDNAEIGGIIGTGLFQQFHVTMDYLNGHLILKPRGVQHEIKSVMAKMPFVKADSHFLLCKALVNGKEMNLFLDSWLAKEESILLPKNLMEYAGIPIPSLSTDDSVGGLGGNNYDVGPFTVNTFSDE